MNITKIAIIIVIVRGDVCSEACLMPKIHILSEQSIDQSNNVRYILNFNQLLSYLKKLDDFEW